MGNLRDQNARALDDLLEGRTRWAVLQGEALALLLDLPAEFVDGVITDPPYSSGGAFRGDRTLSTDRKYVGSDVKIERPDFDGDTRDQRSFAYWSALWLAEALRCSKAGGVIETFTDWRQLPTTTDAVQAGGWIWRGLWTWDKGEGTRPQPGRPRNQCEFVVWGSAGGMGVIRDAPVSEGCTHVPAPRCPTCGELRPWAEEADRLALLAEELSTIPIDRAEKRHQTGKPVALMQRLVRLVERGGLVLDPFAGSGSTGIGALREGRRFLGFERNPEIHRIATEWLEAEAREMRPEDVRAGQLPLLGG